MTNLQRLEMEVKDISLSQQEMSVYLQESDLTPHSEYQPENKKLVLQSALSVLESIANQPSQMKNYTTEDISISAFSDNIQSRIDQLERKIRQMKSTEEDTSFFMLFRP
ncbi:DUF6706 family protein [Salibacterium lacus]|uniref:DUF6706 family protein n=1 Tax=Salibacterium lacus TaxID=1898109 RepID=A0ABW5SXP6_9BACI